MWPSDNGLCNRELPLQRTKATFVEIYPKKLWAKIGAALPFGLEGRVMKGEDAAAFPSCCTILCRKDVRGFRMCSPKIYHVVTLIILG